jgi:predicted enzyme related to lactoylglutathione lyase
VDVDVLFVGVGVSNFETARAWYECFFGRAADVVVHEEEAMWQVADHGWLYIVRDEERAGNSIIALAVSDIEEETRALDARGVSPGPVEPEGDAGLKSVALDPDGNSIALIQVTGAR